MTVTSSRRLLMLCYLYPPLRAPGTTRSAAFASRLTRYGWSPLVLTVRNSKDSWVGTGEPIPENVEVVRTPEWNLHGAVNLLQGVTSRVASLVGYRVEKNYWREVLCIPDDQIAWFSTARAVSLARKCDAIYASCSPFSSALSAVAVGKLTGLPVVLDFRDPWASNPHSLHGSFRQTAFRLLERLALRGCDRLVVTTAGTEALYREQYPALASRIAIIPNGYDALPLFPVDAEREELPFTIMHVGTFYGSRSPQLLLETLSEIPQVRFVQVGPPFEGLQDGDLGGRVQVTGSVSRERALELIGTASVLYLKQGLEPAARKYVAVAAKTYEYLASGLPILADCPEGDNAEMVRRYAAQSYVVTTPDRVLLRQAVLRAMAERGDRHPRRTAEFEQTFDRERLTARLAELLDAAVDNRRN